MSLITQCPACNTLFKVAPEQLRMSEGWVRCGKCSEVFDANPSLQTRPDEAVVPEPVPAETTTAIEPQNNLQAEQDSPAPEEQNRELPDLLVGDSIVEPEPEVFQEPSWDAQPTPDPYTAATEPAESGRLDGPGSMDFDAFDAPGSTFPVEPAFAEPDAEALLSEEALNDGSVDLHLGEPDPPKDASTPSNPSSPAVDVQDVPYRHVDEEKSKLAAFYTALRPRRDRVLPEFAAKPVEPSFLRQPKKKNIWHSRAMRAVLGLFSVALALLSVLQFLVQERDWIVATQPGTRPEMEAVCSWVGCSLAPLRRVDAIAIDTSSFVNVRGGVYKLNVTLKNSAPVAIATPALELTLVDQHEQALVRRIFSSQELGAMPPTLASGAEQSGALTLSLTTKEGAEKFSGYRLLAFYP